MGHNILTMPSTGPRVKNWCFTVNDYSDHDADSLTTPIVGVDYLTFGREIGASGTPHLVGAVCFRSRKRLQQVTSLIGPARCAVPKHLTQSVEHCERRRNSIEVGTRVLKARPFIFKQVSAFWDLLASGIVALIKGDPNELSATDISLPHKRFERNLTNDTR